MQQSAQHKYNSQEDEIAFQNMLSWRRDCKQFILQSLELVIQSRDASTHKSGAKSFSNKFGLQVQNMNELDMLLSSFDSINKHTPADQETPEERLPLQEVHLDITLKAGDLGPVLLERWSFQLALNLHSNKKSNVSSFNKSDQSERLPSQMGKYYKKMCVQLRSLKAMTLALPAFKLPQKLRSDQASPKMGALGKEIKVDYQMCLKREQLENNFPLYSSQQRVEPAHTSIASLETTLGELVVEIEYIRKKEVVQAFKYLKEEQERKANIPKPVQNPFAQLLMNALGPSIGNQPQPQQNFQVQQKRSNTSIGAINDQGRFRANSDNTYQKLSQRGYGLPQQNIITQSPRVSEGFMIKEDYFTAEKNRLYYRVSTKNSGHSQSSEQSNMSSAKGFSPFIPQVNLPTQGSSSLLKSSLEGGTLGNYDSHEIGSGKTKMDYLRLANNSRNQNYRLSFDENIKNNPSQRSFSSLFGQNNQTGQIANDRTSSFGIDYSSLPVQHQLIEEEKDDFDLINPNPNSPIFKRQTVQETGTTNAQKSGHGLLKLSQSMEPIDSTIKISAALERRVSMCSNDSSTLFQINEHKKYIGFLEDGISDADEDLSSSNEELERDEHLPIFMQKIKSNIVPIPKTDFQHSPRQLQFINIFQNEMKRDFLGVLEMKKIFTEMQASQKQQKNQITQAHVGEINYNKLNMSLNPHMYMLTRALRTRSVMNASKMLATRSGGHFHKPDPKLTPEYQHTRLIALEDINTIIYHDFSPEYHMHLHSPFIQNAKQGVALVSIYFLLIIVPVWFVANKMMRWLGTKLYPSVRPGKDHAHMAPMLINHLKTNNYEAKQDALGRRTGLFYKNFTRQMTDFEYKPDVVVALETHGFKF